ncbi:hypothetical protein [Mesorhizobium sp. B2-8-9]|uniref:hypothetical protein n=1 Tax=Mesorhizobium sp. B2-8-9 TaxID=2589899 RepID=UPI0011283066|nr:hypothetical protein [Mesorhizobium sp. B2-8-9]TPI86380.1 hypothetical protein FJ423_00725 [Mesorhizobium sp. B2-8-9]
MIAIDYTITVGNILTILGMGGGLLVGAWRLRAALDKRVNAIETAAVLKASQRELDDAKVEIARKAEQRELEGLRLEMARNYVSVTHLEAVEERMTASMKVVADEVRGLRSDILSLYKERAGAGS